MFKFIKKIQDFLKGKKVYITGVITIVGALVAWSEGAMSLGELFQTIMAALVAMGFRSAIGGNPA